MWEYKNYDGIYFIFWLLEIQNEYCFWLVSIILFNLCSIYNTLCYMALIHSLVSPIFRESTNKAHFFLTSVCCMLYSMIDYCLGWFLKLVLKKLMQNSYLYTAYNEDYMKNLLNNYLESIVKYHDSVKNHLTLEYMFQIYLSLYLLQQNVKGKNLNIPTSK